MPRYGYSSVLQRWYLMLGCATGNNCLVFATLGRKYSFDIGRCLGCLCSTGLLMIFRNQFVPTRKPVRVCGEIDHRKISWEVWVAQHAVGVDAICVKGIPFNNALLQALEFAHYDFVRTPRPDTCHPQHLMGPTIPE